MTVKADLLYGKGLFSGLRTAIPDFKKKHYIACCKLFKGAAAAFVLATVAQVHVDTGMSAATLRPFGRKVGAKFPISPKRGPHGWGTYMTGKSFRGKIRSMSEGLKIGEKAYTYSTGTYERPIMRFSFDIKVYQYWYWEIIWQSLPAGEWAFKNYIQRNYDTVVGIPLKKQLKVAFEQGERAWRKK